MSTVGTCMKKLMKELKAISLKSVYENQVVLDLENSNTDTPGKDIAMDFTVYLCPSDGFFAGAKLPFRVKVPTTYPTKGPKVVPGTEMWHPNISSVSICFSMLSGWQREYDLERLFNGLLWLLNNPNFASPLRTVHQASYMVDVRRSLVGVPVGGKRFINVLQPEYQVSPVEQFVVALDNGMCIAQATKKFNEVIECFDMLRIVSADPSRATRFAIKPMWASPATRAPPTLVATTWAQVDQRGVTHEFSVVSLYSPLALEDANAAKCSDTAHRLLVNASATPEGIQRQHVFMAALLDAYRESGTTVTRQQDGIAFLSRASKKSSSHGASANSTSNCLRHVIVDPAVFSSRENVRALVSQTWEAATTTASQKEDQAGQSSLQSVRRAAATWPPKTTAASSASESNEQVSQVPVGAVGQQRPQHRTPFQGSAFGAVLSSVQLVATRAEFGRLLQQASGDQIWVDDSLRKEDSAVILTDKAADAAAKSALQQWTAEQLFAGYCSVPPLSKTWGGMTYNTMTSFCDITENVLSLLGAKVVAMSTVVCSKADAKRTPGAIWCDQLRLREWPVTADMSKTIMTVCLLGDEGSSSELIVKDVQRARKEQHRKTEGLNRQANASAAAQEEKNETSATEASQRHQLLEASVTDTDAESGRVLWTAMMTLFDGLQSPCSSGNQPLEGATWRGLLGMDMEQLEQMRKRVQCVLIPTALARDVLTDDADTSDKPDNDLSRAKVCLPVGNALGLVIDRKALLRLAITQLVDVDDIQECKHRFGKAVGVDKTAYCSYLRVRQTTTTTADENESFEESKAKAKDETVCEEDFPLINMLSKLARHSSRLAASTKLNQVVTVAECAARGIHVVTVAPESMTKWKNGVGQENVLRAKLWWNQGQCIIHVTGGRAETHLSDMYEQLNLPAAGSMTPNWFIDVRDANLLTGSTALEQDMSSQTMGVLLDEGFYTKVKNTPERIVYLQLSQTMFGKMPMSLLLQSIASIHRTKPASPVGDALFFPMF